MRIAIHRTFVFCVLLLGIASVADTQRLILKITEKSLPDPEPGKPNQVRRLGFLGAVGATGIRTGRPFRTIAVVPDRNGNGAAEIVIGAPFSLIGTTRVGYVGVYDGRTGARLDFNRTTGPCNSSDAGEHIARTGNLIGSGADDFCVSGGKLAFVDGQLGFSNCTEWNQRSGAVADVGDTDNDGKRDIVFLDPGGRANLVSGSSLTTLATFSISGPGNFAEVAPAGDVDNDGHDDFLLGAIQISNVNGYLISGRTLTTIARAGGAAPKLPRSDYIAVAGVGDLDGDGHDDVAWGDPAQGRTFIMSGRTRTNLQTLVLNTTTYGVRAEALGDIDGDGRPELAIADAVDYHIYSWNGTQFSLLTSMPHRDGFILGGDLNGDGINEVILGDPFADCVRVYSFVALPDPGDYIVSDITGRRIAWVDRSANRIIPFGTSVPAPLFPNWITMGADNFSFLTLCSAPGTSTQPREIGEASLFWPGTVTALLGTTSSVNGVDFDQDGSYLVSASSPANSVRRVTPGGAVSTLAQSLPSVVNNLAYDADTGDVLVGVYSQTIADGRVLRVRRDGTHTTLAASLGEVSSIDPEPRTGNIVVTTFTPPQLRVVTRSGALVTSWVAASANAVKVDDATGNYYVATPSTIVEYTPAGVAVNSAGSFAGYGFSAVDVFGSRRVTGSTASGQPPVPGSLYYIDLSFPDLGGAGYVVALSRAQRPGIPIPATETVNLAFDSLLQASLLFGPVVFGPDFVGTLDEQGRKRVPLGIPAFPAGFRFFCSAVAIQGSTLKAGNTIGITLR